MLTTFYPIGLGLLRLFAALMFWQHGAQKLLGLFGGPAAAPFTLPWFVGGAEFVGAIAIAFGFRTRPVSAVLAVDMAILYLTRYLPEGFPPVLNRNGEVACLLFLISSLLVVTGPGRFGVDAIVSKRQSATDLRLQKYYPAVLSIFRLLVGLLFLQHGLQKVFGLLEGDPYAFPNLRWFAGMIELFAGPALALGLFTRPVAFLVCGEMAFAYFINHNPRNFWPIQNQGEWTVLYCYIFLFLVAAGPGKFSLDSAWWKKTERTQQPVVTRIIAIAFALGLAGSVSFEPSQVSAQAGGWTELFDGKTLKGWNTVGNANWEVVDGVVQATSGNGDLVSTMSYSDFQVVVEFWVDDDANSGVFFRCSDLKTINGMTAYEAQIFDKRPDPEYRTGALTFFSKPAATINTGGKWNTYDITAQGSRLLLTLNGTRTVDVRDTKFARGPIALQRTAGIVKFRSVRVRPL